MSFVNKGTLSKRKLMFSIKENICNRYKVYFSKFVCGDIRSNSAIGNNKLRTYCLFKTSFSAENYLLLNFSKQCISNFTKLRIANHRLEN